MESVHSLRNSAPPWWPLREGRDGKCEGRNEKWEFLARESVSSSPIVRIFGKGKCKFIANFSATMVTSLPSLSVSLSLFRSLSPKVPHAQYRKRFRASYNNADWSYGPFLASRLYAKLCVIWKDRVVVGPASNFQEMLFSVCAILRNKNKKWA